MRFRTRPIPTVGAVMVAALTSCGQTAVQPSTINPQLSPSNMTRPAPVESPTSDLPEVVEIESAGATRYDVDNEPDWLLAAADSAWVATGSSVMRLDRDGTIGARADTEAAICLGMDAGFGSIWVGSCEKPIITRLDPRTGRPQATVKLGDAALASEGSIGVGEGGVWGVTSGIGQLIRVDPHTNRVTDRYPVPDGVAGVRAGEGAVWITNATADTLLRVDPDSGDVAATIAMGDGPRFLTVGGDAVWVMNNRDATVMRVDPQSDAVVATISVADEPIDGGDIAFGAGYVWARVTDALIVQIDPGTNAIAARYGPSAGSGSVAADDEAVWISAHDVGSVWRLSLR